MMPDKASQAWIEHFPGLSQLESSTKSVLLSGSRLVDIAAESSVFEPGKAPDSLFFLLEGTIRVQQLSSSGREIMLYRAHAGESCVMTNACLFAYQSCAATGIADTPVRVASIPKQLFDQLLAESSSFRDFVLFAFSKRISDLSQAIDEIAFKRVDVRLAEKLIELADSEGIVCATHKNISVELGTAREVVSRQLRVFQKNGWVEVSRGKVCITDDVALKNLSTET